MTKLVRLLLLLLGLSVTVEARGQFKDPVTITDLRVGLPPGQFTSQRNQNNQAAHIVKRNTWAPVYLQLKVEKEVEGGIAARVSTGDDHDLDTTLTVPLLPNISDRLPGSMIEAVELGQLPYVRSGNLNGKVSVTIISLNNGKTLSRTRTLQVLPFSAASTYTVLSLGSKLPGFALPLPEGKEPETSGSLRGGQIETAAITNVREMPDQWFGYSAADLVVLTTGSAPENFVAELFDQEQSIPFQAQRTALLEWVRRGGHLVISLGSKAPALSQYEAFRAILPVELSRDQPTRNVEKLQLDWQPTTSNTLPQIKTLKVKPGTTFAVANLAVDETKPSRILSPLSNDEQPIVAQSTLGMGRITVVGIDLDQSPFVDSKDRDEVWSWLLEEAGSQQSRYTNTSQNMSYGYGNETENNLAANLHRQLNEFDGVPVISFGWVALFIILYTLLIGPIEYLFLKKIFGRLELTWITFPVIVLTVSAGAYFTAYAIKGKDQKVNKLDLVDIDLKGERIYGRTWMTIFSPRIDSYTISVEPREEWANPDASQPPLVGWMAGSQSGGSATGSLSRGYNYHVDMQARRVAVADGLVGVPIQVWSTMTFAMSWTGTVAKEQAAIADVELFHPPGDPTSVAGSFTMKLPIDTIEKPLFVYAGEVYELPNIMPGQQIDIPGIGGIAKEEGLPRLNDWFNQIDLPRASQNYVYGNPGNQPDAITETPLWATLFHDRISKGRTVDDIHNATLRLLDQSWRISAENRDEAILLIRVPPKTGPAESLMTDAQGPSPSLVWLRSLPNDGTTRVPMPGTLNQETYIRIYLPITK